MKKWITFGMVSMLFATLVAGTAFGATRYDLKCRKKGDSTLFGEVVVNQDWFGGAFDMKPKKGVARCNEKYPEDCGGDCWVCMENAGAGGMFNTCWGPGGECEGANCGKWE